MSMEQCERCFNLVDRCECVAPKVKRSLEFMRGWRYGFLWGMLVASVIIITAIHA